MMLGVGLAAGAGAGLRSMCEVWVICAGVFMNTDQGGCPIRFFNGGILYGINYQI